MMTIHREGYKIITVTIFGLAVLNFAFIYIFPSLSHYQNVLLLISLFIFLSVVSFFRKPIRRIFVDDTKIIAPADGKIVAIEEVYEPEYFKDKRLQVSVFMSPSNVHINWMPVSGKIEYVKYHPGKFLVAWHPKCSTENERNTIVIQDEEGDEILVRQIAGFLARRIVSYPTVGQELEQGNEFRFIKFGSRVDLFLPIDAQIEVEMGQKVKGNKTILATLP
jgi:phosphatidylserine decarboxylase